MTTHDGQLKLRHFGRVSLMKERQNAFLHHFWDENFRNWKQLSKSFQNENGSRHITKDEAFYIALDHVNLT
jgi:hypothetical protein